MISKKLLIFLTSWIIENTEFNQKIEDPKFFKLTENEMSDKACFSSETVSYTHLRAHETV